MARLHRRFLKKRGPTDVMAFDLAETRPRHRKKTALEGEVIVSAETARREAKDRGHSPAAELTLYALHGTLHLLGFRDGKSSDAQAMHRVEDEILTEIGLGKIFGSFQK